MAFRTEITLEELLAEPIVVALMNQDGVSIGDARALYASAAQRLKIKTPDARPAVIKSSCLTPCTAVAPDELPQ
jgi:hypothetical protein